MAHSDTITLPAVWASALVNGDYSGLDEDDITACNAACDELAERGWHVVSIEDDAEPYFTWSYSLYGGICAGGNVLDYTIISD